MIPRLSSFTQSPPGNGPNIFESQGIISLGGASWMLPCAICSTVVNIELSLLLGTSFESRLEVTDNLAAVCNASTSSFCVVYDFIYRLRKRVSNLDLDGVTSLSSPIVPLSSSVP